MTKTFRAIAVAMTPLMFLAVAACKSGAPEASSTTPGAAPTSAAADQGGDSLTVTGEPAGTGGDPCALVTAADVTAYGEAVKSMKRLKVSTDEDGTTQQCALVISGPPMAGPGIKALTAMGQAMGGDPNATGVDSAGSAVIGVVLQQLSKALDKGELGAGDLPPGAKIVTGVGDFGMVFPSPAVGGLAIGLKGQRGVWIMALEGKKLTTDQLEVLLRAAVSRL
jgi:hypothetical protein